MRVEVISSRPQLADRLFPGKTPAEAAALAGRVFALCGQAQRLAATAACVAAGSNPLSWASIEQGDQEVTAFSSLQQAVLMETALEHAWRLLVDEPAQAGLPADMDRLRVLRQAAIAGPLALANALDAVFAQTPALLNTLLPSAEEGWAQAKGNCAEDLAAPLLPPVSSIDPAEVAALAWRAMEEPAFCARPLWRNQPAETGALGRQQDHLLLAGQLNPQGRRMKARWLARRLELTEMPVRLRQEPTAILWAQPLAENCGYAWVETARGALLHVVHLAQGRVAAYRIIAPTEWNFHPAGPFAAGVNALGDLPDGVAAVQALARSLDPCVSYQVEVVDA